MNILGPEAEDDGPAAMRLIEACDPRRQGQTDTGRLQPQRPGGVGYQPAIDQIHRRAPQEDRDQGNCGGWGGPPPAPPPPPRPPPPPSQSRPPPRSPPLLPGENDA